MDWDKLNLKAATDSYAWRLSYPVPISDRTSWQVISKDTETLLFSR